MGQRQLATRLLRTLNTADVNDPGAFLEVISAMCRDLNRIRSRPIWHADPSTAHECDSDPKQFSDPDDAPDVCEYDHFPDGTASSDPEKEYCEEISDTDSTRPHYSDISN